MRLLNTLPLMLGLTSPILGSPLKQIPNAPQGKSLVTGQTLGPPTTPDDCGCHFLEPSTENFADPYLHVEKRFWLKLPGFDVDKHPESLSDWMERCRVVCRPGYIYDDMTEVTSLEHMQRDEFVNDTQVPLPIAMQSLDPTKSEHGHYSTPIPGRLAVISDENILEAQGNRPQDGKTDSGEHHKPGKEPCYIPWQIPQRGDHGPQPGDLCGAMRSTLVRLAYFENQNVDEARYCKSKRYRNFLDRITDERVHVARKWVQEVVSTLGEGMDVDAWESMDQCLNGEAGGNWNPTGRPSYER